MRLRATATLLLIAAGSAIAASDEPVKTVRGPATAPATVPSDAENPFIINDIPLSAQPPIPLDSVVRFRIVDDNLNVETTLPAHPPQMMKVVGLPQPLQVTVMQRDVVPAGAAYQPQSIQLTYVHNDVGHPLRTNLSVYMHHVDIYRDMIFPDGTEKTVQFIQNPGAAGTDQAISLHVQTLGKDDIDGKQASFAESFAAFARNHPAETSEYVRPMIETFGPQPHLFAVPDGLAFTVFPEAFTPSPEEQQQIRDLVKQLGDDSYPVRQAAGIKLEKLGIPAASVLLAVDRNALGPEQASRVDAILAHARPRFQVDPDKLRKDPGFLLDCVLSSNPRLQQAASRQLKAVTGRTVDLPAGEPETKRVARVYHLRGELMPPTTRPTANSASRAKPARDDAGAMRDMR